MLTPTLRTILEHAASDAAFREQLLSKPDEALAGYSLTPDETASLRSLTSEQLNQLAADLSASNGELNEDTLAAVVAGQRPPGFTVTTNIKSYTPYNC